MAKQENAPRRARITALLILCLCLFFASSMTAFGEQAGRWVKRSGALRYRYTDKTYAKGNVKIGKYRYLFDTKGNLQTGWIKSGGGTYYGRTEGAPGVIGRLYRGWKRIEGKTYYFSRKKAVNRSCRMLTGWQTFGGRTYYFGKNGIMRRGWRKISGKYFYFRKNGSDGVRGSMVTGWFTLGKKKYYFTENGPYGTRGARRKSEWLTVYGKKYYFAQDGSLIEDTLSQSAFIALVGKKARADMKKTGILASVTTAQAILESGYGTTSLAMEAHNLFGMKATLSGNTWKSAWDGKTFDKETQEYYSGRWVTITATFRAYDSIEESIADHSAYLRGAKNGSALRYRGVIGNKDYTATLRLIKNGGYATDPNYVSKLVSIIKRYNLTKYDK